MTWVPHLGRGLANTDVDRDNNVSIVEMTSPIYVIWQNDAPITLHRNLYDLIGRDIIKFK